MAEITKLPDKILRKTAVQVSAEDIIGGKYEIFVKEMKEEMKRHNGVGLAANQLGRDLAIFVIEPEIAKLNEVPEIYFNPEITELSKTVDEMEEGCLSIPEYFVSIRRAKKLKLKFTDETGKKQKIKARGFLARIYQHETDHLNGLVIKDRINY